MDFLDRRILTRLSRQLPLADGEELLDFDIGTTRPYGLMPPPWPNEFPENARVEIAVSDLALYFRVESKTYKGDTARLPWEQVESLGLEKADGKWKRWSLKGELVSGTTIHVSLEGRPRPSMLTTLAELVGDAPPGGDQ